MIQKIFLDWNKQVINWTISTIAHLKENWRQKFKDAMLKTQFNGEKKKLNFSFTFSWFLWFPALHLRIVVTQEWKFWMNDQMRCKLDA